MTVTGATPARTPGHPAGCSCGDCGCRQMHAEGMHDSDLCAHGTCFICDGCPGCEARQRDEETARLIAGLVRTLESSVAQALAEVHKADAMLMQLTSDEVFDVELAETSSGTDALAELDEAARHLRNTARIVRERQRLLKASPITVATTAEAGQPTVRPLTPRELADQAVGLFLEYRDTHDLPEADARQHAVHDIADGAAVTAADLLASCGHPANEDGECGCASWPERAPVPAVAQNPEV